MPSKQLEIPDELIDEIVNEVLDSIPKQGKILQPVEKPQKIPVAKTVVPHDAANIGKRIDELENNLQKLWKEVGIIGIESGRELNEKIEDLKKENEDQIMQLEEQINFLRNTLAKLSNELKKRKII